MKDASEMVKDNENHNDLKEGCFSRMETLDDNVVSATFTFHLEVVAFAHSASGSLPTPRYDQTFDGILIETRAAKESSAGSS